MPALAVADALSARGASVSLVGTTRAAAAPTHRYPVDRLPLRGFVRALTPRNLWVLAMAVTAVPRAMAILRR
ncbi:MAG: UDP-N-acetylglucosamine--N-acetylmuramyl-(pentapeptide) pyrophosphoryl-undecaprenol N-acetylglucosamine transferase, partial [Actinomycetota bacterium]